jgi:hypothetical protein
VKQTVAKDLYSIMEEIDKYLFKQVQNLNLWAEQAVSITAILNNDFQELRSDIRYLIRDKRKENVRSLSIISWYLPDEIRYYLQIELKRIIGRNPDFLEESLILKRKGYLNIYLCNLIERKGLHHLFGNILDKKKFQFNIFQLKLKIKNPNIGPHIPEKQYIGVGYKDKGCLPEKHKTGLSKIDYWQTQLKIEKNRQQQEDLQAFFEGYNE